MKELEQTNELTIMKAKAETAHQKDSEFKLEFEKLTNKFEAQKLKDFQLHSQLNAPVTGIRHSLCVWELQLCALCWLGPRLSDAELPSYSAPVRT